MARAKDSDAGPAEFAGSGGIVTAGGRTYAVGLQWEGVSGEGKPASSARALAPSRGADLICVRKPGKIQFGLGAKAAGHKAGMAPLAAFLAETVEGSFVGAFETDQGYYLVAVREDQILAGVDRLIPDRDEALEAFHELFVAMAWGKTYAPKEWNLEGTEGTSLEDTLSGVKPRSLLEPVSQSGKVLKALGAVAVLGLLFFGYTEYQAYQERVLEEETAAAAAEAARIAREEAARAPKVVLPPYPWEGRPQGIAVLAACVDAVLDAPIEVPGWTPTAVNCALDANPAPPGEASPVVQVAFTRQGGTLNWIAPALNRPGFRPSVTVAQGGGSASASWPLSLQAARFSKDSRTGSVGEALRYMTTQFEEIFQPVDLKPENGQSVQAPLRGQQREVVLERHLAFSFKTRHDPRDYAEILAPLQVNVITAVKLDLATFTWTVEGTIYEQVPLPDDLRDQQGQRNAGR